MAGSIVSSAQPYMDQLAAFAKRLDAAAIDRFGEALFAAWRDRRRVFTFGNGGSACTASHHVSDYVKTAAVDGARRLDAMCLNDNIGMLTALGNDASYDQTLVYPLASFARKGDVAVAISCSGNSPNVVLACEWARQNGLTVVSLTGFSGGKIGKIADIQINVPSDNYGVIEDLHMSVGHIVAQILKSRVSASPSRA
jgi:phosphoheptose isomerase